MLYKPYPSWGPPTDYNNEIYEEKNTNALSLHIYERPADPLSITIIEPNQTQPEEIVIHKQRNHTFSCIHILASDNIDLNSKRHLHD